MDGIIRGAWRIPSSKYVFVTRQGQKWFCQRCETEHTSVCDYKVKYQKAYEARQKLEESERINTTNYSDSTLRKSEKVGTSADIHCTPGGTIGHIANMLTFNTKANKHQLAGTNDILEKKGDGSNVLLGEFTQSVDKSMGKIQSFVNEHPTKFVLPQLPNLNGIQRTKLTFTGSGMCQTCNEEASRYKTASSIKWDHEPR